MGWRHRLSGEKHWLRVSAIPLFEPGQEKPSQICSLFYSITESREATNKLARLEQELRELSDRLQPVLGMLTTQSTALNGNSEIAGEDSSAWRECAQESLEILQRLAAAGVTS